jgi:YD repeat-containing protein
MEAGYLPCTKSIFGSSGFLQICTTLRRSAVRMGGTSMAGRHLVYRTPFNTRWAGWRLSLANRLLVLTFVAFFAMSGTARADDSGKYPVQYSSSPHGINLQTGIFSYNNPDLRMGDLTFVRSWGDQSAMYRPGLRIFGPAELAGNLSLGWNHNLYQGTRARSSGPDTMLYVVAGDQSYQFIFASDGSVNAKGHTSMGTYLRRVGNEFRFTDRLGTEFSFMVHPGVGQDGFPNQPNQVLREAVKRDGTVLTYTYLSTGALQEVRSSRGYSIHLDYNSSGNIVTACAKNLAVTFVNPQTACDTNGPRTTYSYSGDSLTSFTDVNGSVTQFQYGLKGPTCISVINSTACAITNVYGSRDGCSALPRQVVKQITATGDVWLYCYEPSPSPIDEPYNPGRPRLAYSYMTEPSGAEHFLTYDRGRLINHSSQAGRINYKYPNGVLSGAAGTNNYTFEFTDTRPAMITEPEGNVDYYIYNNRDAVILYSKAPKGAPDPYLSNGQPALSSDPSLRDCCIATGGVIQPPSGSLSFGQAYLPDYGTSGCGVGPADAKRCDQPIARIDPKGNQTDYTYDQAHGGVLTETGAAVNGGIRPQIRYGYVQRYARIRDANGNYIASGSPIWLVAWRAQCRTSSAGSSGGCSVAGDEVVTNFEYGPDTGPNNLLLRGEVISADGTSIRTCYTYDGQGNQVSKTLPNANLLSCP